MDSCTLYLVLSSFSYFSLPRFLVSLKETNDKGYLIFTLSFPFLSLPPSLPLSFSPSFYLSLSLLSQSLPPSPHQPPTPGTSRPLPRRPGVRTGIQAGSGGRGRQHREPQLPRVRRVHAVHYAPGPPEDENHEGFGPLLGRFIRLFVYNFPLS